MKGLVFSEFLELVEQMYGYEMVDKIIENAHLPSSGSYTSVGTYSHLEMFELLTNLSKEVSISVDDLLRLYGNWFFDVLMNGHKRHLNNLTNSFDLLYAIEDHIHVEVKKLYPEAELPSFETTIINPTHLKMIYSSERKMWALAWGLMEGCFKHYKEKAAITYHFLVSDGSKVQFDIHLLA